MSWLGVNLNESLRNIGGQISSLTKEVLSEDLDDGDGGSEVVITRRRFCELQTTAEMRLQEVQALTAELQEVKQRLHAADLQAAHRSEARNADLTQLQEEVRILREQQATWQWGAGGASDLVSGPDDHHRDHNLQLQQVQQLHREEVANLLQQLEQLKAGVPSPPPQVCCCTPAHTCGNTGTPAAPVESEEAQHATQVQQEKGDLLLQLQQSSSKQKEDCSSCTQLQQENSVLQESLQQLDAEHQANTETLLAKRNELLQTVAEQSQTLLELRQQLDTQQQNQEQQQLIGTYQHQIQNLLEEKNLLQDQIKVLNTDLVNVKQQLQNVTSDQSAQESEAVKTKECNLEAKVQQLQDNASHLAEELSKAANGRDEAEQEKQKLQAALSELPEALLRERQEWESKHKEMEGRLAYMEREAASVQDQQHNAIKSREEALTTKTHEVMQLKVNVAELERIATQLGDRIATQDRDAEQQALAALKAQRHLEAQVRDLETEVEGLRATNLVGDEGVKHGPRKESRVADGAALEGLSSEGDAVVSTAEKGTPHPAMSSTCEGGEEVELEATQRLVEVEAALEREKTKFGKVQEELWEREKELQQLRESQQRWMLEGEVPQVTTPADQSPAAARVMQLGAYVSQLRLQLRDTTHLLQASHIQQAELGRELDELKDQLEAEEGGPCLGRTPPDGGCVLSPSPSRLLHTIDEEEVTEGYLSNIEDDRELEDGEQNESAGGGFSALKSLDTITEEDDGEDPIVKSVMVADRNQQQPFSSIGGGVEPGAVVERLQQLSLTSMEASERSQLLKKVQALTTETCQLRALVSRLEKEALIRNQFESQLNDGGSKEETGSDDTALVVATGGRQSQDDSNQSSDVTALQDLQQAKQTLEEQVYTLVLERDAVKTQLIYKQDQYDNLVDGVRKASSLLGQEDDSEKTAKVDVDDLCESVAAVVERLKKREVEHSPSPPPPGSKDAGGEGSNSPSPPPGTGGKGGSRNKKLSKVIDGLKKEKAALEKKVSSVTSEKDKALSRMKDSEEKVKSLRKVLDEKSREVAAQCEELGTEKNEEKDKLARKFQTLEQCQKNIELHLNNIPEEASSALTDQELPLNNKVEVLVKLFREQREEVFKKTRELEALEEVVTQAKSSANASLAQLEDLQLEEEKLKQKMVSLESANEDVEALRIEVLELEEVQKKNAGLSARVEELAAVEELCNVFQLELEECKSLNKRYNDDIETLKTDLQAYSSLKEEYNLFLERVRAIELERDSALNQVRTLGTEVTSFQEQLSSLQIQRDKLQTENESSRSAAISKLSALQTEHDSLLEQHRALETREGALLTEVQVLTTAAAETREVVQALESDKAGLSSQLQYLQAGSEEQQQKVMLAVEEEKRQVQEQLQEAHRKQEEDVKKVQELENELRSAQNLAGEVQNQLQEAVKTREDTQNELVVAQNQLQETQQQLQKGQQQLQEARQQLQEAQQQLQAQVQSYTAEREQLVATVTQKHQESVTYHTEILRLGAQLAQVSESHASERQQLVAQLEETKQRCEKLQLELAETTSAAADAPQHVEEEQQRRRHAEERLRQVDEKLREARSATEKAVQEKQQLMLANKQFNAQYEDLAREVTGLKESESRQLKEASRLKEHLLAVEEQQTKEQLQAQATEQQLRAANARLQEKIQATSVLLSATSERTSSTVEQLQTDVARLQLERQQLNEQLQQLQEEHRNSSDAASTLQQVLAEFQRDQTRQLAEAAAGERRRQETLAADNTALRARAEQLSAEVSHLQQLQQEYAGMQQQLRQRDQSLVSLQGQVSRQLELLKASKNEVALLKTGTDAKVDKTLVRNLVLGYLTSTAQQQRDALPVLATVLDMSPEERIRAGITRDGAIGGKGWMSSLADILAPPASNVRVTSKVDVIDSTSLSQAFVRFLEEESQPKPSARLPALLMAEETENRAKKADVRATDGNALVSAATLSFPFSPTLHPAMPAPPHPTSPRQEGPPDEHKQEDPPQQELLTSSRLLSNLLNTDPANGAESNATSPT